MHKRPLIPLILNAAQKDVLRDYDHGAHAHLATAGTIADLDALGDPTLAYMLTRLSDLDGFSGEGDPVLKVAREAEQVIAMEIATRCFGDTPSGDSLSGETPSVGVLTEEGT